MVNYMKNVMNRRKIKNVIIVVGIIGLIALILFKLYYFIFKIKTITPEEKAARDASRTAAIS